MSEEQKTQEQFGWQDVFLALADHFNLKAQMMDQKIISAPGSVSERAAVRAVVQIFGEVFSALAKPGECVAGHRAFVAKVQEEASRQEAEAKPLVEL